MSTIQILPEFVGRYFGQRRILEHLSVLIRWAEQREEELPPLLFTGAHGQGQRVLAGLIAERLSAPLHDLCLYRLAGGLRSKLAANGKVARFASLEDLLPNLPGNGAPAASVGATVGSLAAELAT